MYLPQAFIYKDIRGVDWVDDIDKKYRLIEGEFYQAFKSRLGYVNKYYCGVSNMQSPFFFLAHQYSKLSKHPPDGFSRPYQLSILLASLVYTLLGLLLLRWLLLQYYSDKTTAISVIAIVLATNIVQYICIDSGQTHTYLFFLYCCILFFAKKWHDDPKLIYSSLLGLSLGLAIVTRPTEGIAILIPILWASHSKEAFKNKWKQVWNHQHHLLACLFFGTLCLLPQFGYWKYTTNEWIFDVGSVWQFFDPYFRVLFGFEKGWFVYTPISIFFIIALFKIKSFDFYRSVIFFNIFNIWIIIAWADWRYGGSYSTRALSQSYPVFALAFGALVQSFRKKMFYRIFLGVIVYLTITNLFQIYQYNQRIIHYDHMNYQYYKQVYWNPNPSSLQYSLLDTKDWIKNELKYNSLPLNNFDSTGMIWNDLQIEKELFLQDEINASELNYVKSTINLDLEYGFWGTAIKTSIIQNGKILKSQRIRLFHPAAIPGQANQYSLYTEIPEECLNCKLRYEIDQSHAVSIRNISIDILGFQKKS